MPQFKAEKGVSINVTNSTQAIANILLTPIKEKFEGNFSCIPEIKEFWHNAVYLLFSIINSQRLFGSSDAGMKKLAAINLMPMYLLDLFEREKDLFEYPLKSAATEFFAAPISINDCRQELLNVELNFSDSDLSIFFDKISRDNTGSYYTPPRLAEEIIKKTFNIKRFNPFREYKIADFSCGGGDFFLAIMKWMKESQGVDYKKSVRWFYGADIDPIALQICVVTLLLYADRSDWDLIISHFKFGNPLLVSEETICEKEKNALFATGRLYSKGLGLPKVFFDAAYDAVVGNPPWEKIKFEERKFFRGISDDISAISQKNIRRKEIRKLENTNSSLFSLYTQISEDYSKMTAAQYRHEKIQDSIVGELNTYLLFTDLAYNMLSEDGLLALVVKSTLATAPAYKKLWSKMLSQKAVKGVFLFDNSNKIFNIDSRERFIVLIASKVPSDDFDFATGLTMPEMLNTSETISLTQEDLLRINPFTGTIPNVRNNEEVYFLKEAHSRFKLFSEVYPDCHFGRLIHLTAHAQWIDKCASANNIPIYEGKFIEQYDSRYSTFCGMPDSKKYANKASSKKAIISENGKKELPESRFFIKKELWNKVQLQYREDYSLCWRSLTSPTNSRTMLATILPTCPTCQSIQMLQTPDPEDLIILLALFNSIIFDYFVRIKMPGLDLTQGVIKQIPVPSKEDYNEVLLFNGKEVQLKTHILSFAVSLLREEERLSGLLGIFKNKVYEVKLCESESKKMIDLMFKKAYHLDGKTYDKILKTFPKY